MQVGLAAPDAVHRVQAVIRDQGTLGWPVPLGSLSSLRQPAKTVGAGPG